MNQLYLVPGFSTSSTSSIESPIYSGLSNAIGSTYLSEVSTYYPSAVSPTFTVNGTDQLVLFPDANGYIPFFSPSSLGADAAGPYGASSAFPYLMISNITTDLASTGGAGSVPPAVGTNTFAQQLATWMNAYPNSFGILTTDSNTITPGNFGYITTYSYIPPYLLGLNTVALQNTSPATYLIGSTGVSVSAASGAAALTAASQFPLYAGAEQGIANATAVAAIASAAGAVPFQFVQDYIIQLTSAATANASLTFPSYLPASWIGAQVEYDTSNFGYFSYLQYAGMHYWGIFPSGSGTLQYDSNANKFVASLMNDETYTQALQAGTVGKSPNLIANGRLAIEGGAIISNVIANPSSDALVPQFILQNGSEKWRLALITDMGDANGDGGVMKLAIQRLNTTTLIWETIDDFQSDTQQQNGQAVYNALMQSQSIVALASQGITAPVTSDPNYATDETTYLAALAAEVAQQEQLVQPTPFEFTDPIGDALTDSTNASDPNIQIQSTSDSSSS
jgi:hypothetical protein